MKSAIFALCLGLASAGDSNRDLFEQFKKDHKKSYVADEEEKRFNIFVWNLKRAKTLQNMNPTAQYGVTKFSDLTEEEFSKGYLGLKPRSQEAKDATPKYTPKAPKRFPELAKYVDAKPGDLPTEFDWREMGAVTAVKDQGYCGSCWSFGTTGDVEGTWFLAGNNLTALSEEQLVQCDFRTGFADGNNLGCQGGLQESAFNYLLNEAPYGLVSEEHYPYSSKTYQGITGDCDTSLNKAQDVAATISAWNQVSSRASQEDDIYPALVTGGPVTIGINASPMQLYRGGISNPSTCPASGVDHAVLIVGYGVENGVQYWNIKNSWAADWGEDGYYRIVAGSNKCGLATDVVHSVN